MSNFDIYLNEFSVDRKLLDFCDSVMSDISGRLSAVDEIAEYNQLKVLSAMQKNRLSDIHFAATTGYGYNDLGRDKLEAIYASVFRTETALVRPQIISGTHALSIALSGNLRSGDELLYVTGSPYDTLCGVIGLRETRGSLAENGIIYKQADLIGGKADYEKISLLLTEKTKIVAIQRSKGYSVRHSLYTDETEEIIAFVKSLRKDIICLVDNCYCEFTDIAEPSSADMIVGSLIKNPGGSLAPVGGYIAGTLDCVENAAARLTAPGLGREVGPTLGVLPYMIQGLFFAPTVVSSALKGVIFASELFHRLGYDVSPKPDERRADIVQAINMKSPEELICFCRGIQAAAPVDSFVVPEPWDMPGYDCPVIMAAGAFVQGSSIELSADAPLKPPYTVFLQGGVTWPHAKAGVIIALNNMLKDGFINLNVI